MLFVWGNESRTLDEIKKELNLSVMEYLFFLFCILRHFILFYSEWHSCTGAFISHSSIQAVQSALTCVSMTVRAGETSAFCQPQTPACRRLPGNSRFPCTVVWLMSETHRVAIWRHNLLLTCRSTSCYLRLHTGCNIIQCYVKYNLSWKH